MYYDRNQQQVTEIKDKNPISEGVCFDPDKITLEGYYVDELSAHRAKRSWNDTLENYFLLDSEHDFKLSVQESEQNERYELKATFLTACARYAFWRLTNGQAPEAQYCIETGHIPNAESSYENFRSAPDMYSIKEPPLILGSPGELPILNQKWFDWVKDVLERIKRS